MNKNMERFFGAAMVLFVKAGLHVLVRRGDPEATHFTLTKNGQVVKYLVADLEVGSFAEPGHMGRQWARALIGRFE